MISKFIRLISLFRQPKLLKKTLSIADSGYLKEIGWINSFNKKLPVDDYDQPVPWVTYGFIDFISERLNATLDIFEYGSGNSTIWYAKRVNSVTSIEHDKEWFEKVKTCMPSNVSLSYSELEYGGEYSKASSLCGMKFEMVIVDGRDRVNSIKNSTSSLKHNGVIVLDDSEREAYSEGIDYLINCKFKRIDFWGISPGLFYKKNTTIFYKQNNCLGI